MHYEVGFPDRMPLRIGMRATMPIAEAGFPQSAVVSLSLQEERMRNEITVSTVGKT
jgi:hypothetical protein